MPMKLNLGVSAAAAALAMAAAGMAHADTPLPGLTNLNFLQYNGYAPKNSFTQVNPVGWTGGSGLIYIDAPGTATSGSGGIPTYKDPGALNIAGGYNYVEADGNPDYESGFSYKVTGLTAGQTYSLSFYQAASQEQGFSGDTTNRWIVSLGTEGLSVSQTGGPNDPTYGPTGYYYNNDPTASIAQSQLMSVPSEDGVPWEYVTVTLKADASTDLLSFLAWGDNGSTINAPPMAFLTGVNSAAGLAPGVPEPATWALTILGFAGLGGMLRRERSRRTAVCA